MCERSEFMVVIVANSFKVDGRIFHIGPDDGFSGSLPKQTASLINGC